ncbi:hydroxyacid dehydrogenase [Streptomyces sp. NPDC007088]|uniref:hydroxyacid dehydrogenase n=1 Tax=Streptomyces sp. NPDC007088 TaxID=3364773 RepID=UPI00368558AB
MADRPVVAVAMGQDVVERALPAPVWERLTEVAEIAGPPLTGDLSTPAERSVLARAEVLLTGWGCPTLDSGPLSAAPLLRAVCHAAGTVKGLVTDALWERGITVSSAASANAGPVVDYTLACVTLAAKRALATAARYPRWPGFLERTGLDGRSVGVVGASRIGRGVIAGLRDSGAQWRVLLHDPYVSEAEAAALGAEAVSLPELCRRSDIVTVHAPELPATRGMLNAALLALIPDGGALVNTARGSLVDTEALVRECASGRIDAYLDVTDPEPLPAGHPLLALPNVLVTPHIAGAQGAEVARLGRYAVAETERYARGEPLQGALTRADLDRIA